MLERDIERKFVSKAKSRGMLAMKFTSPNMQGVPDRIVLMPGGIIRFVEFKRPGMKPRKLQRIRFKQFEEMGFPVTVIDSMDKVDDFFKGVMPDDIQAAPISARGNKKA
ncbi:MAG: VRR-NUC domain-containing protein [Schwartzia sp.]|nr:VRR-NUC domain-containing protein [Schwartzia sp. (in: firmicutes)]